MEMQFYFYITAMKHVDTEIKNLLSGLPWELSGKESTCRCRGRTFDPWSGKTPHVVEQQSLGPTTTEPVLQAAPAEPVGPEPVLCNRGATKMSSRCLATRGWPLLAATGGGP